MGRPGAVRKYGVDRYPGGQIAHRHRTSGLPKKKPACVYVICALGLGQVKIGVSELPAVRVSNLMVGNPNNLAVVRVWPLGRERAFRLERECHRRLRGTRYHLSGEWYRAEPDAIEKFIVKTASEIGIKIEEMPE